MAGWSPYSSRAAWAAGQPLLGSVGALLTGRCLARAPVQPGTADGHQRMGVGPALEDGQVGLAELAGKRAGRQQLADQVFDAALVGRRPAWVSRSQARTRRSSAARGASGNWRGCSPAGSTSGRRARVSASMPLDLAWRRRNRRRSGALAELTRYTVWPRAAKNTAIGSHAGPVGSTTTSRRVPAGRPGQGGLLDLAKTVHGRERLAAAHRPCRRRPAPGRCGRWLIPRSIPTSRRSCIRVSSLAVVACSGRSDGRRWITATVPRGWRPTTAPTHVLQPAPTSAGRATSLIRGIRGRPRAAIRRTRLGAHQRLPQRRTQRHPRNQPGCTCNPGTMVPIKHRGPLHE